MVGSTSQGEILRAVPSWAWLLSVVGFVVGNEIIGVRFV